MPKRPIRKSDQTPMFEPLEPRLLLDATSLVQAGLDEQLEAQVVQMFDASPAVFVENQGQWADESVRYSFSRPGAGIVFTDEGPVFHLYSAIDDAAEAASVDLPERMLPPEPTEYETTTFRTWFEGANAVTPVGLDVVETSFNYFVGDPSMHRSNVPGYSTVVYSGLYEGVDLHLYGGQSNLKYEFHVSPGADWEEIVVSYEGIEGLAVDGEGNLHVQTELGELVEDAPYIYQDIDGERIEVAGQFELVDADTYTFSITGSYDATQQLVIDPDLAWATYLGRSGEESGGAIAVDSGGSVYMAGVTGSYGLATPGAYKTSFNESVEVFVAKMNSSGTVLLYCTYLGGAGSEWGNGIAVDSAGNAYVTGYTQSSGWATPGAYDTTYNGTDDVFVAKLNTDGSNLLYCTYLGGSGDDNGNSVAIDSAGNAYVTGYTQSSGWATPGAYDTTYNGTADVFVAKLNSDGSSLLYCTYLGGSGHVSVGWGIEVDSADSAYVAGHTYASGWATPGAYDTTYNGTCDVFVAKLNSNGSSLLYCTYLGGSEYDWGYSIAVDSVGHAYVTGFTESSGWATPGAYDTTYNGTADVFVAKLNSDGSSLLYCTYLGGSVYDYGYGIGVDSTGQAYVTGFTDSSGWATPGAYDTTYNGGRDGFMAKVNNTGSGLIYCTYLGGSELDYGRGIAVDSGSRAYVTGMTRSPGWATSGVYDTTHNGTKDVFVAKLTIGGTSVLPDLAVSGGDITLVTEGDQQRVTATVHNSSGVAAAGVLVRFRDLDTGAVVGTETISSIAPWDSADVSVLWTPSGPGALVEVMVDPYDAIEEVHNSNNMAVAVYGAAGGAPIVAGVLADWDADGDGSTFGRFVSDISLWNTFAASVIDPDGAGNVDYVTFTLGSLSPVNDTSSYGGWTASFDMGLLSGDSTLSVVAYDAEGQASDPWTGTVHVVPFPSWLGSADEDDYFGGGHYHLNGFFPEQLNLTHTIPSDWWIIGGMESEFKLGVELEVVAGLNAAYDVPIDHEFVFGAKILDYEVFDLSYDPFTFEVGPDVTLSLSGLADGDDLSLAGLAGSLTVTGYTVYEGSVPEVQYPIVIPTPIPIPVTITLGMNFGVELDAQLNLGWNFGDGSVQVLDGSYVEPVVTAEPYIFGGVGVPGLNIGLEAGGELGLNYRGEYNSIDGYDAYSWGTFRINLRAVATAGRKHTLATWTVPSGDPWSFGDVPPGEMMWVGELENGELPDILPWPNVTADSSGNVLLTRVLDVDADLGEIDPEVFYAMRDSGGTWSTLSAIATNDLIESDPDGAYNGSGGAVVSWVANTIDPALAESVDWDVYLATQELYSSYWNGSSWSVPQVVTSDSEMDGGPEVAFDSGAGLMLWEHAGGTGSMDLDGFEVYYAAWNNVTHTWGAPTALTSDSEGDWAPTVAFGSFGEAMAVWVHDADSDPTTAELYYATWNGSTWSAAALVPLSSASGVREPRIAYASNGDVLLGWVGKEGAADILYTSRWDHTSSTWSTPEAIPDTPGVIEGLDLAISGTDEAMLVWHGWDGQNDLFSTVRSLGGSDPWTPPARITDNVDGEWMASTAFDSAGVPVTVWANENATTVFGEGAEGIELELAPDLESGDVEVLSFANIEGEEARVMVQVTNAGWAESGTTTVEFYLGDPGAGGTAIGSAVVVDALAPGSSESVLSDIFVLPAGTNDYYAVVTAVAGETVTGNNSAYTTLESLPPDVTGPQVALDLPADAILPDGTTVLILNFDEPVTNLAEWDISLVEDTLGVIPPDHVYLSNDGTSATLVFEGGLQPAASPDTYTFRVLDSVMDLSLNALDGDADGNPGADYEAAFSVALIGDANVDGKVDGADLAKWQQNYDPLGLNENIHSMGDWNGDGKVDGTDLALWQQNYNPLGIPEVLPSQASTTEAEVEEVVGLVAIDAGTVVPLADIEAEEHTVGVSASAFDEEPLDTMAAVSQNRRSLVQKAASNLGIPRTQKAGEASEDGERTSVTATEALGLGVHRVAPFAFDRVTTAVRSEASGAILSRSRTIHRALASGLRLSVDEGVVDILELTQLAVPLGM